MLHLRGTLLENRHELLVRSAGLLGAGRRAFVADGSDNNWAIQRRFFGSWTPVLDFIHALSYVFAAATAGRKFAKGWPVYVRWITWLWQGQAEQVIVELAQRQAELGAPEPSESETSPRAEAILQLRADILSDDRPLDVFWQRREASQTGQRRYKSAA